jgi:hypothetical protein
MSSWRPRNAAMIRHASMTDATHQQLARTLRSNRHLPAGGHCSCGRRRGTTAASLPDEPEPRSWVRTPPHGPKGRRFPALTLLPGARLLKFCRSPCRKIRCSSAISDYIAPQRVSRVPGPRRPGSLFLRVGAPGHDVRKADPVFGSDRSQTMRLATCSMRQGPSRCVAIINR